MEDDSVSSSVTRPNGSNTTPETGTNQDEARPSSQSKPSAHDSAIASTGSQPAASDDLTADSQLEKLQRKNQADMHLANNGFVRVLVHENRNFNPNLQHDDWRILFEQRDGHCLIHSLLGILHARFPDSEIKTMLQLRDALASYFESLDNQLEITNDDGEVFHFVCDSIDCLRSGKDDTGELRYFGGLPECVAFSFRFGISLEVLTPEVCVGSFICQGGGKVDCAPEAVILVQGWDDDKTRRPGQDHWQRAIRYSRMIPGNKGMAVGDNCVVTLDGDEVHAKVAQVIQQSARAGPMVYCYRLNTCYAASLGYFFPTEVRLPDVAVPPNPTVMHIVQEGAAEQSVGGKQGDSDDSAGKQLALAPTVASAAAPVAATPSAAESPAAASAAVPQVDATTASNDASFFVPPAASAAVLHNKRQGIMAKNEAVRLKNILASLDSVLEGAAEQSVGGKRGDVDSAPDQALARTFAASASAPVRLPQKRKPKGRGPKANVDWSSDDSKGGMQKGAAEQSVSGKQGDSDDSAAKQLALAPTFASAAAPVATTPSAPSLIQAADVDGLSTPSSAAVATETLVAKIVISDGCNSVVIPTSGGTRLVQYCLEYNDRFKWFTSGSTSSSKVLMGVCKTGLSHAVLVCLTGDKIMSDSCVTCVGFETTSLDTVGEHLTQAATRLTQTATHCIVGLPPVIRDVDVENEANLENVLEYTSDCGTCLVKSAQFWMLATPRQWVPGHIVDWYGSFLSVNHPQSDVKVFTTDFFNIGQRPGDEQKKIGRLDRFLAGCRARNCFPCYFEKHFTLVTWEAPTERLGRVCFMDSLDLFAEDITRRFQDLFERKHKKIASCLLNGGSQVEDPPTECAIFCMQNMEAFMKSKPFFKAQEWESAARQRTPATCKDSRNKYAALLREKSVQYLLCGTPVSLTSKETVRSSPVIVSSDDEVPAPAPGSRRRAAALSEEPTQKQQRQAAGEHHRHSTRSSTVLVPVDCTICKRTLGSGSCQKCMDSLDPRISSGLSQRSELFHYDDAADVKILLQAGKLFDHFSTFLNYAQRCYDEVILHPQILNKYKSLR
jgi:hypothetical protein